VTLQNIDRREYVERAVAEYDRLGREEFLKQYGFGESRQYYLRLNGVLYDSKAIVGVAHQFANSDRAALNAGKFSGGLAHAVRQLRRLGFEVIERTESGGLVLVENEVTYAGEYDHWADVTGVSYQFPNRYRRKVQSGLPFVYYRGVRRREGRGNAEYFGVGRIGEVSADESTTAEKGTGTWTCAIVDFIPFVRPVRATAAGAGRFESMSSPLGWRDGIRTIAFGQLRAILDEAGLADWLPLDERPASSASPTLFPSFQSVTPVLVDGARDLLRIHSQRATSGEQREPIQRTQGARSPLASLVGRRAEDVVMEWLRTSLTKSEAATLDHVAARGIQPGWDLEYRASDGSRVAVEVKGTTAPSFASIEISANEWSAAIREGDQYWLYLVANCASNRPVIQRLRNPAQRVDRGEWSAEPAAWLLRRVTEHTE
jgi:hypothetical protein